MFFFFISAATAYPRANYNQRMRDSERYRLRFGPYQTPAFAYGARVNDLARGRVVIVGLSAAKIPWPIGKRGPGKSPVLYGALANAVRREAKQAVAHWFGVSLWRVQEWRKALEVPHVNKGTSRLKAAIVSDPKYDAIRAKAYAKAGDPQRREKIAASKRGKPRPRHVIDAMANARSGSVHSAETRARMSAAHKALGTAPPGTRRWSADDDNAVRTLSPADAAKITGRTLTAVFVRRGRLKLSDRRRRGERQPARLTSRAFGANGSPGRW